VHTTAGLADPDIFHKNLMPVSYVFGDRAQCLGATAVMDELPAD
jgi:hypothetical protein